MPNRRLRSPRSLWASFGDAVRGLAGLAAGERNFRIQLAVIVVVAVLGGWLGLTRAEWLAVLVVIGLVGAAEALNTAVEVLGDRLTVSDDPMVGHAKDIAAGAVLWAVIAAILVGAVIFVPHLQVLFRR